MVIVLQNILNVAKAWLKPKSLAEARLKPFGLHFLEAIFSVALMQVSVPILIIVSESAGLEVSSRLNL